MKNVEKNTDPHSSATHSVFKNLTMNTVSLQVHITNATQIRGTKGDKTSSFVRVQFADFDSSDSPIINEMINPNYDFNYNLDLTYTDLLLDTFLNSFLMISVYEVLPKDKNALLASVEIPLSNYFFVFSSDLPQDTPPSTNLNLGGSITTNLSFCNQKLLSSSVDSKENTLPATISLCLSLNKELVPLSDLDQSNIIEFLPLEFSPLPEEIGLKELNDRDTGSAISQFSMHLLVPMDSVSDRTIVLTGGTIVQINAEMINNKKFSWSKSYKAFLSSEALKRLRERIMSNDFIEGEIVKMSLGKPGNYPEPQISKHRIKFQLDMSSLIQPEVLKSRVSIDAHIHDGEEKEFTASTGKHRASARPMTNFRFECEIKLKRPLISKKPLTQTAHTIFDFIPRVTISKSELYAKRVALAETKYKDVVDQLVSLISGMYTSNDRTKFLQHIQDDGVYNHIKATLKPIIIRLIKEKFPKFYHQDKFTSLSEIYVYLTDLMNKQLSSHFHAITLEPPIEDRLSQLKRDAEEAESLRDWSSAKQYLLDCVCLAPDDLLVHLDLAQCHGRCGEHDAALELLKTILNRNPKHVLALQTLGMLTPDLRLSETCFLNLVKFDPQQYTVLALLALHYDMINEGEKADTCATEATQQRKHEIYLDAAEIAVKAGATKYAEAAFSQYSLLDGSNIRGYLLRAKLYQQLNNFDVALSCLKAAKKIRIDHPEVCAALGHLYFSFDCFDEAKKNYEVLLSYYPELDDSKVLSRLATIYYKEALLDDWNLSSECKDEEKMKIAQRLFIQSKEWAWTGLTCLVLNQMEEAEAVLCKATTTNPRKPCSWIALSIFHLNEGHIFEAEQCANYALSLGLRNISILRTAANAFHLKQREKTAMAFLKCAMKIDSRDARLKTLFQSIVIPNEHS